MSPGPALMQVTPLPVSPRVGSSASAAPSSRDPRPAHGGRAGVLHYLSPENREGCGVSGVRQLGELRGLQPETTPCRKRGQNS